MAISYVGSTEASENTPASGSWTLPVGWQAGDLAIVWLYSRAGIYAISAPASITGKHDSNNANSGRLYIGYRYLQTGDTTFDWTRTVSSSNSTTLWGVDVFRGTFGSGDPFEADTGATPATFSVRDPDPPAVTPATTGAAVWAIGGKRDDAGGSFTAPTNYTLAGSIDSTFGNDAGAATIYRLNPSIGGSEDPGAIVMGGTAIDGLGWTGAIKPAAAAGTDVTASAGKQTATLTQKSATVSAGSTISAGKLSATLTQKAVTVTADASVTVSKLSLGLTQQSVTVSTASSVDVTVTVGKPTATLTLKPAVVSAGATVALNKQLLTLALKSPSVVANTTISVNKLSVALAQRGVVVTADSGVTVNKLSLALALSGATVAADSLITVNKMALALSLLSATVPDQGVSGDVSVGVEGNQGVAPGVSRINRVAVGISAKYGIEVGIQ